MRETPTLPEPGLHHLTADELFPKVGTPIHVHRPLHQGNIPLHDHDFMEIAVVVKGWAVHRTIHGQQPIRVGDVFVLHPAQWHAFERCHGLEIYNCCFGVGLMNRELAWVRTDPLLATLFPARMPVVGEPGRSSGQGVLTLRLGEDELAACVAELEQLRAVLSRGDGVRARADHIARLLLILGLVARNQRGPLQARSRGEPDPAVATAIQALEERLQHDWSLAELAKLLDLNRSYLVRLFKRHAGHSPMAWLARRRAEKAAVLLLTTNLPVAEIGRTVGWRDPNYFARRFRAAFGTTASAYRAQLPCPALVRADDWIQW